MNRLNSPRFQRRASRRQQGAAMMLVMLVLLITTAMATYAVHSTTTEIRATGHLRQMLATQYAAESGLSTTFGWIDSVLGVESLRTSIERSNVTIAPFEPNLAPGKKAYRIRLADFANLSGQPISASTQSTSNPRNAFDSTFTVDITDHFPCTIPGERIDGLGASDTTDCFCATYTSRGRSNTNATAIGTVDFRASGDTRDYHEGASDTQAHGVTCRK